MTSCPQPSQRFEHLPSQCLRHADSGDNDGLVQAVSVLRQSGECHADDAVSLFQFGHEVSKERRGAEVEYCGHAIFARLETDFPHGQRHHSTSLRSTQ